MPLSTRRNAQLARAIRWIVTAAIVAFLIIFARTIDWTSAWASIRGASLPLLLVAVAVNFLSIAIKGVRWWLFLRPAGVPSLSLALRATLAGFGLNNVLVANGGDAARVVFVARATGVPSSTVLATLALERLFDPVGFMFVLVYGFLAFTLSPELEKWRLPAEIGLVATLALLGYFVYASRNAQPGGVSAARSVSHGVGGKIMAYLRGFAASTRELTSAPRFAGALVISILSWAGQVVTFELSAAAAHVDISPVASLAALLAVNLGFVIRVTPGNVGLFQFLYIVATEPFGVPRGDAIVVSLLIQTIQIIPITLAGVALAPEFIFRPSRKSLATKG